MRREAYCIWIAFACSVSVASGVALWVVGEHMFGAFGIAAGAFHALWGIDAVGRLRGRWRRRPIVIPRLRSDTRTVRHG